MGPSCAQCIANYCSQLHTIFYERYGEPMSYFDRNPTHASRRLQKQEREQLLADIANVVQKAFACVQVAGSAPAREEQRRTVVKGTAYADSYDPILARSETPCQRREREATVEFSDGISSVTYGGNGKQTSVEKQDRRTRATRHPNRSNIQV